MTNKNKEKKEDKFAKDLLESVKAVFDSEKNKKSRSDMDRYLAYFRNEYWNKEDDDLGISDGKDSEITVNLLFSTVTTIAPLLTDNRPIWYARARVMWLQAFAEKLKTVTDILWTDLDMDQVMLRCCMDALIMRFGMAKVWFDNTAREGEGEITIECVDPRTFVMAPGYTDPWDAPWAGTITSRPLSWVWEVYPEKKDEVYPDNVGNNDLNQDGSLRNMSSIEACNKFTTVYEIWIRDNSLVTKMIKNEKGEEEEKKQKEYPNGRYVILTEGKKGQPVVLDDRPFPYNHGKPPFVALYDYVNPHEFEGICEADQLEGLILETNYILRKVSRHVRAWAFPNFSAEEGSGIDEDKWKEEAPGGGNLFIRKPGTVPPQAIMPPQLDRTALEMITSLFGMIEEISGVTEVTKGRVGKKERQSASEIQSLIETSYTRTRQRVRNLESFIKKIFKIVLEIMMQFYVGEPRSYSKKVDDGYEWHEVSSSKNFVRDMIAESGQKAIDEAREDGDEKAIMEIEKSVQETLEIFDLKFVNSESVYIPIEPEIQTNSSLPIDKQSLANLALRLFELQGIDREALFEFIRLPKGEEVATRMNEKEQAAAQAQQQPGPQQQVQQGMM